MHQHIEHLSDQLQSTPSWTHATFASGLLGSRLCENPIDIIVVERVRWSLHEQNSRDLLGIKLQDLLQVKDELGLAFMVFRNAVPALILHDPNPAKALEHPELLSGYVQSLRDAVDGNIWWH